MKSDIPRQKQKKSKNINVQWIILIFFSTVVISAIFSLISTTLLSRSGVILAVFILLFIVLLGILFDVIGVAVTAADAKPFHSMAAHRVHGAQEALSMLKNAEKVSSFCNDVVGDICGVISGTASAALVVLMISDRGGSLGWLETGVAALVSGLTVGGKAVGKSLAMKRSTDIVHAAARVVYYLKYARKSVNRVIKRK